MCVWRWGNEFVCLFVCFNSILIHFFFFTRKHIFLLVVTTIQKVKMLVIQSCPTLCDPTDCSSPGFSVHGILQARILEWVAIPFSRNLPNPGIKPGPHLHCRQSLYWLSHQGSANPYLYVLRYYCNFQADGDKITWESLHWKYLLKFTFLTSALKLVYYLTIICDDIFLSVDTSRF